VPPSVAKLLAEKFAGPGDGGGHQE
jgi:hypothetical protein